MGTYFSLLMQNKLSWDFIYGEKILWHLFGNNSQRDTFGVP